jgi:hypothetical protein
MLTFCRCLSIEDFEIRAMAKTSKSLGMYHEHTVMGELTEIMAEISNPESGLSSRHFLSLFSPDLET